MTETFLTNRSTILTVGESIEIPLEDAFPSLTSRQITRLRKSHSKARSQTWKIIHIDTVTKTVYLENARNAK